MRDFSSAVRGSEQFLQNAANHDDTDDDRCQIFDGKLYNPEVDGSYAMASATGNLVQEVGPLHPPAHVEHDNQCSCGHEDIGSQFVTEVEQIVTANLKAGKRALRQGTEGAEHDNHGYGNGDGGAPADAEFFGQIGHNDFQQGYGGGDGGYEQNEEKENGQHRAEHDFGENERQCDEDEAGTLSGRQPEGEDRRHDGHTGDNGKQGIGNGGIGGHLDDVDLLGNVGGIGENDAEADAKREEGLSHGFQHRGGRHFREVGAEQEVDAALCPRQCQGTPGYDEHHQEQQRHQNLGEMLDAALHSEQQHTARQRDKQEHEEQGLPAGGDHLAEQPGELCGILRDKLEGDCPPQVVDGPPADNTIEGQDQNAAGDGQYAENVPVGARRQLAEGTVNVGLGTPPDDELCVHDGQRHDEDDGQVDDDEGGSPVVSNQVGESPQVTQTDGGTGHGYEYAEITCKSFSLVHFFTCCLLISFCT